VTAVPWVIGTSPASRVAAGLGAELDEVPSVILDPAWSEGFRIEEWRAAAMVRPEVGSVVVVIWPDRLTRTPLRNLGAGAWFASMETQFALWFGALAAGAERCADRGQVVAVVDRPNATDAAGWSAVSAVADAVENMTRSLAQIHQPRGVRVNLVTTSARLDGEDGGGLADVVEAVAMLLANEAAAVTAATIHLGGGRR
jgi:NAD(P)-dependent dehydrogenase (short-subunit alcohol dehydrogenase family)